MRNAKCVAYLQVTVLGNLGSVSIGHGWQGDLDQVIGRTDRGPETLAQALGHHLTTDNFQDVGEKPAKPAARPHTQE